MGLQQSWRVHYIIKRKPISNFKRYVYAEIEIEIRKYYEMRML